ncbi:MAG: TatD family hydrolase [Acidimicrobiales bacterium]
MTNTVAGWIDSHCHIQDRYLPEDTEAIGEIEEAVVAGVTGLICIGTDPESSRQAVQLVAALRTTVDGFGSWATVGLHPHDASGGPEALKSLQQVIETASTEHPGVVVAVGECGLDYHYEYSPRSDQRQAFEAQIALAAALDLTLVVHTRTAWDDTIDLLRSTGAPERVVIHCFTGGPEEARRCLDLGAYLSFSGIITFKGAPEVRDAAVLCPRERLLVETDAPFLAPVPHRGKPNRTAWVAVVGQAVAGARGEDPVDLAESSSEATRNAFRIAPGSPGP